MKLNFFKWLTPKTQPVPVAPAIPVVVPPDTSFEFVEPNTDRFLVPKDVKDIHTLFDYLVNRTLNKGKDAVDAAIGEMDSFIKDNEDLCDLRHIPGLICTDGLYLLEKGTSDDDYNFMMVRLNSWKHASQSPFFNGSKGMEFIKNKLKDEAMGYVSRLSAFEVEHLIFKEILSYDLDSESEMLTDNNGKPSVFWYHRPFSAIKSSFLPEYLDMYAIRYNDGFSFTEDIINALNDEIDAARDAFRGKKLFAILNNHVYYVSESQDGHFMFKDDTMEDRWNNRNLGTYWACDYMQELSDLKKMKNEVLSFKGIPYISDAFKIKFIGL